MWKVCVILGLLCLSFGYEQEGNLLKLTNSDFDQARGEFPYMLVKFFAPWCGHCKKLAPTYLEVADSMKDLGSQVRLAEVDCTVHKTLCEKFGVRGYPTLQFFEPGKPTPTKYSDARSKAAMVSWLNKQIPISKEEAPAEEPAKEEPVEVKEEAKSIYQMDGGLYQLTAETFPVALNEFDFVLVKFFAPWCGHCKKLAPAYLSAANKLNQEKSRIKIAEVDCTVHKAVCQQNEVKGYPTLKFFVRGNDPVKFDGQRTQEGILGWLQDKSQKMVPNQPSAQPEEEIGEL